MKAGSFVGLELMRSFVDLQIPGQACPLVRGDAGEPVVITSTLSLFPAAIQFGGVWITYPRLLSSRTTDLVTTFSSA
jgi:hypothetical protein